MGQFLARVELHDKVEGQHEKLHELMANLGLARTFTDGAKIKKLPTSMYIIETPSDAETLANEALVEIDAAEISERGAWIIVVPAPEFFYRLSNLSTKSASPKLLINLPRK